MTVTVGIGQLGIISKKPITNFYYFPVSAHILYLNFSPQIRSKLNIVTVHKQCTKSANLCYFS